MRLRVVVTEAIELQRYVGRVGVVYTDFDDLPQHKKDNLRMIIGREANLRTYFNPTRSNAGFFLFYEDNPQSPRGFEYMHGTFREL